MKITVDTNVLVRAAVQDDVAQAQIAMQVLQQAKSVAVPLPVFCEFVWVFSRAYKKSAVEIAEAIRKLADCSNFMRDRAAVAAGLAVLEDGGDFADGLVAHEGLQLGAEEFVSFDRKAVSIIQSQGLRARLLG